MRITYSASKSIFRFGTDPKLFEWYVDVSRGSGLLEPVNLKQKNKQNMLIKLLQVIV